MNDGIDYDADGRKSGKGKACLQVVSRRCPGEDQDPCISLAMSFQQPKNPAHVLCPDTTFRRQKENVPPRLIASTVEFTLYVNSQCL
jgi:hypothetical protein